MKGNKAMLYRAENHHKSITAIPGVISEYFDKGALGAMPKSGCGLFVAKPIFL